MKKKLIASLALASVMVLALAGCSSTTTANNIGTADADTSGSGIHTTNTNKGEEASTGAVALSSSAKAGDVVTFGTYEQDAVTTDGTEDISWYVLDVQNGQATLLAVQALAGQAFNSSNTSGNTYATSDIKQFLEGDFKTTAFTSEEQAKLVGEPTLMTQEQANTYFTYGAAQNRADSNYSVSTISSDYARCEPTALAVEDGAARAGAVNGSCDWWLQTASEEGDGTTMAMFINNIGELRTNGCYVEQINGVRPVITVKL